MSALLPRTQRWRPAVLPGGWRQVAPGAAALSLVKVPIIESAPFFGQEHTTPGVLV